MPDGVPSDEGARSRPTVGSAVAGALGAAGVHALYGAPLAGLPVIEVEPGPVASAFARAHRAVHGAAAAVHLGGGHLDVLGAGARRRSGDVVVSGEGALDQLATSTRELLSTGGRLVLDLELAAPLRRPVPLLPHEGDPAWVDPEPAAVEALATAARVVVLAGPGVVHHRAVPGLQALAAAGGLGVLNTWGAKGVFHWRSRYHLATAGLQERDFALGGLADADVVLAVGLDDAEAPPRLLAPYPLVRVHPASLAPLAERWPVPPAPGGPPVPPLRPLVAEVTQAGWTAGTVPVAPSLVTRQYAAAVGPGGLVAADAGVAGFWVARTFTTPGPGAACVPSVPVPGWAAACVAVARLADPLRLALAVVDGPPDEATAAVLAAAERLGVAVAVEAWEPDGLALGPEQHAARLAELVGDRSGVVTLATDGGQLAAVQEAAGPVVAWRS